MHWRIAGFRTFTILVATCRTFGLTHKNIFDDKFKSFFDENFKGFDGMLKTPGFWGPDARNRGVFPVLKERPQNLTPPLWNNFQFCFANVVSDVQGARRYITLEIPLLHPHVLRI